MHRKIAPPAFLPDYIPIAEKKRVLKTREPDKEVKVLEMTRTGTRKITSPAQMNEQMREALHGKGPGDYLGLQLNDKLLLLLIKRFDELRIFTHICSDHQWQPTLERKNLQDDFYILASSCEIVLTLSDGQWKMGEQIVQPIFELSYSPYTLNIQPNLMIYNSLVGRILLYASPVPEGLLVESDENILNICRLNIEKCGRLEDYNVRMFQLALHEGYIYYYCNLYPIEDGRISEYYLKMYQTRNEVVMKEIQEMSQMPKIQKSFDEYFTIFIDMYVGLSFQLLEIR